jgi:hypothetical protein
VNARRPIPSAILREVIRPSRRIASHGPAVGSIFFPDRLTTIGVQPMIAFPIFLDFMRIGSLSRIYENASRIAYARSRVDFHRGKSAQEPSVSDARRTIAGEDPK